MEKFQGTQQTNADYLPPRRVGVRRPHTPLPAEPVTVGEPEQLAKPRITLKAYLDLVRSDLFRKTGRTDTVTFFKTLLTDMGFKHCFWLRTCNFVRSKPALRRTLYPPVRAVYLHYQHKHGIWIPPMTRIGPGLLLVHMGGIVVNGKVKIGKNCNLSHGVTIGKTQRGARKGVPTLGDNVFVGPGALVVGNVTVGNDVAVAGNSVVTRDVPEQAVVAGVPAKVISYRGSGEYINDTDY